MNNLQKKQTSQFGIESYKVLINKDKETNKLSGYSSLNDKERLDKTLLRMRINSKEYLIRK
jgi:hypothetical protein